jgi:two-component system, sensor histidine kinase RegB
VAQSVLEQGERIGAEPTESRLRLQTIMRLRWFGVLGQLLAVAIVYLGFGFHFPLGYCLIFIAISAWVNVFLRLRYPGRLRLNPLFAVSLLTYDTLQLIALLYLTGGIENPFVMLIIAPVTVSAATLPPRYTIYLGALALGSTALLIAVETWPLPWYSDESLVLPAIYKLGLFAAVAASMIFLALYTWRLSKEARQMSAALTATELVLAREQKLHALDGLASAAAHELGTPLATIVLVAKELEREVPTGTAIAADIELLRSQAQRCREILQRLTRQPSEPDPLFSVSTLSELLSEAAEPHRIASLEIEIDARAAPETSEAAIAEPVGERRPGVIYGLSNIIQNAVDFAGERVDITARWDDKTVEVRIADDGPGFLPNVMDTLGEPYVTTRPAAPLGIEETEPVGMGLGFFIAKTLLERSGAILALENRTPPQRGAVVRITWPRGSFETQRAKRKLLPVNGEIEHEMHEF